MQKELAQRLLTATLNWSPENIEQYSNLIDNFAELKYDEYQQYRPGSRFVEHLCAWLNQFEAGSERETALNFLLKNLTFISTSEMHWLIDSVYPEIILPIFESQASEIIRNNPLLSSSKALLLDIIKTKSLFFALSDGARIDILRRTAGLEHDQVCVHYEISSKKCREMMSKMDDRVNKIDPVRKTGELTSNKSEHLFLLDDFSASGISYLRKEGKNWDGKIFKAISGLMNKKVIDANSSVRIHIILYLATEKAINRIKESIRKFSKDSNYNYEIDIHCVQKISPVQLSPEEDSLFEKHYLNNEGSIADYHYKKGDMTCPHHGFDGCSLALVIHHNTPNNSFPIIWAGDNALFPRVTRHKDVR